MPTSAIACDHADIAPDKAHRLPPGHRADRSRIRGIDMPNSGFVHKQRGRAVTQAQAGAMLDAECAVRADCTWLNLQVAAQRLRHSVGPGKGAHRRTAYAHHGPTSRLSLEHRVEVDDTIQVGKWHI